MTARINKDYQITLPQEVRNTLGVKAGEGIRFVSVGKVVYLLPARPDYSEQSKQYCQNWEKIRNG